MKKRGLEEQCVARLQQLLREKQQESHAEKRQKHHCQEVLRAVRAHAKAGGDGQQGSLSLFSGFKWAPAYAGLAVVLLIVAFQFYKVGISTSDTGVQLSLSQESVEELEDEKEYPTLPENIRLFSPPTGGDGTILPAQFKEK